MAGLRIHSTQGLLYLWAGERSCGSEGFNCNVPQSVKSLSNP